MFDCDGTLVESEFLGNRVLVQLANQYGFQMPEEEARRLFRGRKLAACMTDIEAAIGQVLPESFVPDVRAAMNDLFRKELEPVEGVESVLEALSVPVCVASGAPLKKIKLVLEITSLTRWFDDKLYSSYELDMWKPDPDLFLHAAQEMGVASEQCAVIEDSPVGVQAGVSAGMTVYHYAPDRPSPFADHPQVTHIQSMNQLLEQLQVES